MIIEYYEIVEWLVSKEILSPFGQWDSRDWFGRYQAIEVYIGLLIKLWHFKRGHH